MTLLCSSLLAVWVILPASTGVPSAALPAPAAPAQPQVFALKYDLTTDVAVTAGALTGWLLSEGAFKNQLAPLACRWCGRDAAGVDRVPGVDRLGLGAVWENRKLAARLSDVGVFAVLPAAVVGMDLLLANNAKSATAGVDLLLIAQAAVLAQSVNQVAKLSVGRERPYVHLDGGLRSEHPNDDFLSFFSGHATFAFSLVSSAGTVAHLRNYRSAWVVWAVGLPVAGAVSYLRMAGAKHYFTDVATGALIGSAMGAGLPLLFHGRLGFELPRAGISARIVPSGQGAMLMATF